MKGSQKFIAIGLVLFLIAPFLVLMRLVENWQSPHWPEVVDVLWFTFSQAWVSAFLALLLGLWGGLGLLSIASSRWKPVVETLFLLPNFLPQLFVILAFLNFTSLIFGRSSQGFGAIVAIHVSINAGLIAVAINRFLVKKMGGLTELALIEGASFSHFCWKGVLPLLQRELSLLFLLVFALCFTSFSVPLVVGGIAGTTLEVLIYEKVRISQEWGQAVVISILQVAIVFILSLFLFKAELNLPSRQESNMKLLQCPSGLFFPLLIFGIMISNQIWPALKARGQFWEFLLWSPQWLYQWGSTVAVGLGVGFLLLILLSLMTFCWSEKWLHRMCAGYMAPSTALTGFAFLVLLPHSGFWVYLKLILGITLIAFPSLYRWLGESTILALEEQVKVARTLGASPWQIFWFVQWPQVAKAYGIAAGVAAFWACGDFAYSSIVTTMDITLALLAKNLMSFYRLELATLVVWWTILTGFMCFFIMRRFANVFGQKPLSKLR